MPTPPKVFSRRYLWNRLISGLFILVPLWVTCLVVKAAFNAMASVLQPLVALLPLELPGWVEVIISILAFILLVLLVGIVAGRVVGQRFLFWGESLILKIPVIKAIYSAAKQVVDAVSMPERKSFKSVVMVEYPRPGIKVIGFMTGFTTDEAGHKWCRVFIPMSPLPTSGFMHLVPFAEVRVTDMTVEEAFKMLISGGFIAPDTLATHALQDGEI
ncbi:MAG: DUF502 domain-containing protein [bacterium]